MTHRSSWYLGTYQVIMPVITGAASIIADSECGQGSEHSDQSLSCAPSEILRGRQPSTLWPRRWLGYLA